MTGFRSTQLHLPLSQPPTISFVCLTSQSPVHKLHILITDHSERGIIAAAYSHRAH